MAKHARADLSSRLHVFQFIVAYKRAHDGASPTMRQIVKNTTVKSTSNVSHHLQQLQKMGCINIGQAGAARAIEVVGGRWVYEPNKPKDES